MTYFYPGLMPRPAHIPVTIRRASPADASACLALFRHAILTGARGHYSLAQRRAWSHLPYPVSQWRLRQSRNLTLIAEQAGRIVGFTEFRPDGHVHMLFVDPACVRQGIGTRLLNAGDAILTRRGAHHRSTWASDLSRPVFARAGYRLLGINLAISGGQRLRNWRMVRG